MMANFEVEGFRMREVANYCKDELIAEAFG